MRTIANSNGIPKPSPNPNASESLESSSLRAAGGMILKVPGSGHVWVVQLIQVPLASHIGQLNRRHFTAVTYRAVGDVCRDKTVVCVAPFFSDSVLLACLDKREKRHDVIVTIMPRMTV